MNVHVPAYVVAVLEDEDLLLKRQAKQDDEDRDEEK